MGSFKKEFLSRGKDYQMAWFISFLIGIEGIIMAFICAKDSNWRMVVISLIYGMTMLGIFIHINITKKIAPFYAFSYVIIAFLTIDFLIDGGITVFSPCPELLLMLFIISSLLIFKFS